MLLVPPTRKAAGGTVGIARGSGSLKRGDDTHVDTK